MVARCYALFHWTRNKSLESVLQEIISCIESGFCFCVSNMFGVRINGESGSDETPDREREFIIVLVSARKVIKSCASVQLCHDLVAYCREFDVSHR